MTYTVENAADMLARTPRLLRQLLGGLPREWIRATEGPGTWSPVDVLGHLIHGEKTDWIPRARIILGPGPDKRFPPFDREAMLRAGRERTVEELLDEFAALREGNLRILGGFGLDEGKLSLTGIHPEFGTVTLRQHLATWVAHDLSHIAQIVRVLALQYREEVGPWVKYLGILQREKRGDADGERSGSGA